VTPTAPPIQNHPIHHQRERLTMQSTLKKLAAITTVGIAAIALAGCSAQAPADTDPSGTPTATKPATMTDINFRLDFTTGSEHLGYLMAQELGYYKDAGLNVEISEGQGSAIGATLLASGKNDIGIIAAGEVLAGVSRGLPIHAVATVLRSSPEAIIYNTAKVKVDKVKDLEGHSIGVDKATSNGKIWLAIAAANDVDLNKVNQVNAGKAVVQALLNGDVDSIMGYSFNQGLQARAGGVDAQFLSVKELGMDIPNHTIAVNDSWAADHKEAISAFLDATKKGWQAVIDDKEKALDVLIRDYPKLDRTMMAEKLDIFLDLMGPIDEFGTYDAANWKTLNDVYSAQGLLEKDVTVEGQVYDTSFVK